MNNRLTISDMGNLKIHIVNNINHFYFQFNPTFIIIELTTLFKPHQ